MYIYIHITCVYMCIYIYGCIRICTHIFPAGPRLLSIARLRRHNVWALCKVMHRHGGGPKQIQWIPLSLCLQELPRIRIVATGTSIPVGRVAVFHRIWTGRNEALFDGADVLNICRPAWAVVLVVDLATRQLGESQPALYLAKRVEVSTLYHRRLQVQEQMQGFVCASRIRRPDGLRRDPSLRISQMRQVVWLGHYSIEGNRPPRKSHLGLF